MVKKKELREKWSRVTFIDGLIFKEEFEDSKHIFKVPIKIRKVQSGK